MTLESKGCGSCSNLEEETELELIGPPEPDYTCRLQEDWQQVLFFQKSLDAGTEKGGELLN